MAVVEHQIILTWTHPNVINKETTKDAINNILMMGTNSKDIASKDIANKYKIIWKQACAKIIFQNEKDKNFVTQYVYKLKKLGYNIRWEKQVEHVEEVKSDTDDDLDLQGITPGSDIPKENTPKQNIPADDKNIPSQNIPQQNIQVKNLDDVHINDLVEINSDPEEDDKDLHIHKGYITKKAKDQITIKENTKICNYFFDEVTIQLIRKNSKTNEESKVNEKEKVKTKAKAKAKIQVNKKVNQKPVEKPIEQPDSQQHAYFGNDNGTPDEVEEYNNNENTEMKQSEISRETPQEKPLDMNENDNKNELENINNSNSDPEMTTEKPLDLMGDMNENDNKNELENINNSNSDPEMATEKPLDLAGNVGDNKSDSETGSNNNNNNETLGLENIDVPVPLHSRNDSFFNNFNKRDNRKELEQENSAVVDAFNDNEQLLSRSQANLFPNITAPLQSQQIHKPFNAKSMMPQPGTITTSYSTGILANNAQKNIDAQFKCNICNKSILATDWTNNNVEQLRIGTKWQHLYCKSYVSLNSQYSMGSVSSCTINALEATMQLQMGQRVCVKLIDQILELSSLYKENKHTCIEDVFPYIKRYYNNLKKVEGHQIDINNLKNVLNKELIPGISAVVTKPPETVFMHNRKHTIIIYDSHPRSKQLNGSHFLVFNNKLLALKYLTNMWPYQYLGQEFNDLRAQQINMCNITLFKLKKRANPSIVPDKKQMGIELKKIGVTLQRKWYKTYGDIHENTMGESEIDEKQLDEKTINYINKLRDKINKLEDENSTLKAKYQSVKTLLSKSYVKVTKRKESERFSCKKCGKKYKNENKFMFTKCKCESCRECASKYFEKSLKKRTWPIKCLICNKIECDQFDFEIFGQEIYQPYCQLRHSKVTTMACPQCENELMATEWNKNKKKIEKNIYYVCPQKNCKFKFCVKCQIQCDGFHFKLSCEDALKVVKKPTVGKCENCHKLLVNKAGDKQKLKIIVMCRHCKKYNCFECGKFSDKKYGNVANHVKKYHQSKR